MPSDPKTGLYFGANDVKVTKEYLASVKSDATKIPNPESITKTLSRITALTESLADLDRRLAKIEAGK